MNNEQWTGGKQNQSQQPNFNMRPNNMMGSGPMPPMIMGKFVNDLNDIRPTEVPNNGFYGIYPRNDQEMIYAIRYDENFDSQTVTYIRADLVQKQEPMQQPQVTQSAESKLSEILEIVRGLDNRVNALENWKVHQSNRNRNRNNKNSQNGGN